jgi:hypothetical protein
MFPKKKLPGTIAILDIESGSVGSALVGLRKKDAPALLGQERNALSARGGVAASVLLKEIEREIEKSLGRLSEVSQRLKERKGSGEIERIAVFLHAPWTTVSLGERAKGDAHEETLSQLRGATQLLGVPVTFHAFSTTTTPVVHGIFGQPKDALIVSIGGEVAELSLLKNGSIAGYATVPAGINTLLRTLEAHGGVSRHEALSILSLSRASANHAWAEALASGVEKVAQELKSGAGDILSQNNTSQHIFVLSREPAADFFARALTEDPSMQELFAPGSTIRPILARHASEHLSVHPIKSDVALALESLFVDTRFGA